MQRVLAGRLSDKAKGTYIVTREEEVADLKRTDIRLLTTKGKQKAVIEVKIADKRWSLSELEQALRVQLVGKYLRDANCKAGCLLLTNHDKKKFWMHPETNRQIYFPEMITFLNEKAKALEEEKLYSIRISVFGLDLTEPADIIRSLKEARKTVIDETRNHLFPALDLKDDYHGSKSNYQL